MWTIEPVIETEEGLKADIIKELKSLGVCDFCTLRYLGVKDGFVYKDNQSAVDKILDRSDANECPTDESKLSKPDPCSACLGLLQECLKESCLDQIAGEIKKADIEASSYGPMLSLPISVQIRAFSIWFYLLDKFPQAYKSLSYLKPEGIGVKSVWKWACTADLRTKVDNSSEWMTNGDLVINIILKYDQDNSECMPLIKLMRQKNRNAELTRGTAEQALFGMDLKTFRDNFPCPPTIPSSGLILEKISCSHMSIFIAGRYCKYSREVSQSPWLDNAGKRIRGLGSVQEYIFEHVTPIFNCDNIKLSSSGREDSDVRMLGKGRPFVLELINPKKTIFTQNRIKLLQKTINESTSLISVRDLQIVDKRDLTKLKDGEETKNKLYTALCQTPGREVTPEVLKVLNETKVPIVLQQITPLRVLHRRTLLQRPRSILAMSAEPAKRSKEMFILHVKTEAGTYVKEFVHGDFGRTVPNVSDLLGYQTEILSLDVTDVELDWPPVLDD